MELGSKWWSRVAQVAMNGSTGVVGGGRNQLRVAAGQRRIEQEKQELVVC